MDKRKSLAHMILENHSKAPASPLRRRSSIAIQSTSTDLRVNDDEAERAIRRKETNVPPASPTSTSRRSLTLDAVNRMSAVQIADGIAECIRLNTQNKINMKNAFSLQMIDFMMQMVANKGEVSNLQMASQSLDVSTKIYGLRVDVLHQEIFKMIGNLGPKDNDASNNAEGMDTTSTGENPAENQKKKKKKRKTNTKILTTIEELQGSLEIVSLEPIMFGEADCQTSDMLYQAMFPQHFNSGVSLHPFNDVIFDTVNTAEVEDENVHKIPWPPLELDGNREICSMFTNFEFLNWSAEEDTNEKNLPSEPSLSQEQLAFDLDASLPVDNPAPNNGMNYFDMDMDNDEGDVGFAEAYAPAQVAVANNIVENVPKKNLEYSYLEDAIDIRWVGPSHWRIKTIVRNLGTSNLMEACRQDPVRKKKPVLEFEDDIISECEEKFAIKQKNTSKLKPKTAKTTWSDEKITLPMENHDDKVDFMCKYELRPDDTIKFIKRAMDLNVTVVSDGAEAYDYANEHDTTDYCPNVETDDHPADDNETNYAHDGPFDVDASQPGFTGTNLVEAPKYTQKIFIPFSQRAKKLDMRHLKKCIWKELATIDEGEKENSSSINVDQPPVMKVTEEKYFSAIYADLPNMLSKNDAEDLSYAIAFISLLHVANEKGLKIIPNENLSDLIITQDPTS